MSISKDCRDNLIYFSKIMEKGGKEVDLTNLKINKIVDKFEADYDVCGIPLITYIIIFNIFKFLCFLMICFQFITNNGSVAYFRTNKKAPNYRIIAIDLENPAEDKWKVIVPVRFHHHEINNSI